MKILSIFLGSILINNIVLSRFLGICPFLGVSKKTKNALGMSGALLFVLLLSSIVSYGFYFLVLVPLKLEFLKLVAFILIIASLVQFVEIVMKRFMPGLYKALGIYLPLITTNCVVLTVALDVVAVTGGVADYNFLEILIYSLSNGLGFALVFLMFSFTQEKLANNKAIPAPFKGNAVALITAGLMALAFVGFQGMI
ncbi:MAG: electron transport complex protein RnfA [Bacilli bacterium]|jgi:electron transport complex protein RnfA